MEPRVIITLFSDCAVYVWAYAVQRPRYPPFLPCHLQHPGKTESISQWSATPGPHGLVESPPTECGWDLEYILTNKMWQWWSWNINNHDFHFASWRSTIFSTCKLCWSKKLCWKDQKLRSASCLHPARHWASSPPAHRELLSAPHKVVLPFLEDIVFFFNLNSI